MTDAQPRDGRWSGMSRLYKIVAIILALVLAITWWLGRGADSRFGCLPGASTAAVSGTAAALPSSTVVATPPAAAAPAPATPVTPAPATPAVEPVAPTAALPAPVTPAAVTQAPVTPAPVAPATKEAVPKATTPAGKNLPVAKVHFALDRIKLWSGADKEMSRVLAYLKANPDSKAVLSGYHDASGNPDYNIELAKNRSHAVRDRLIQLGINRSRIIEEKPAETTGDGPPAEARRVEISIRP